MPKAVLKLHPDDNVLIALRDLRAGERVEADGHSLPLTSDVSAKHKVVVKEMSPGDPVIMYGVLVGKATKAIPQGSALTVLNIRHDALTFHEKTQEQKWTPPDISRWNETRFLGYQRSDGQVGTRNYWLVVPLVFCENRNIETLKQAFEEELGFAPPKVYRSQVAEMAELYKQGKLNEIEHRRVDVTARPTAKPALFKNVDGIKFLMHQAGCGGTREDSTNL
jgi:altronate hydrolase